MENKEPFIPGFDNYLKLQVTSEHDSKVKARNRKLKADAKRKTVTATTGTSASSEPPKKRANARTIPLDGPAIDALKKVFFTIPIYCPVLDVMGLYCGLENSTTFHLIYPVMLSEISESKYLLGVTKPTNVFMALRRVFHDLYGDVASLAGRVEDWEVYRANKKYYGHKTSKTRKHWSLHCQNLGSTRPFGGNASDPPVHFVEEIKAKHKVQKAKTMQTLKEEGFFDKKYDLIPHNAKVFPSNYLRNLRDLLEEKFQGEKEAEKETLEKLKHPDINEILEGDDSGSYEELTSEDS